MDAHSQQSISRRDYFAAHAPAVPDWFICGGKFPMPPPPEIPEGMKPHSHKITEIMNHAGKVFVTKETVQRQFEASAVPMHALMHHIAAWSAACCQNREMNELRRMSAWAYAYADEMLISSAPSMSFAAVGVAKK